MGLHRATCIVRIPSCAFHLASSCGFLPFHHADSTVQVASCGFHLADSILWFHCAGFIVGVLPCGFYSADFIVRIPSGRFHRVKSMVRIPLYGFHRASSIVGIPLYRFHLTDSIVQIPLCGFHRVSVSHCVHSIVCIPSCKCNRWKKEEVKEDEEVGKLAHCIRICICVAIGDASIESLLGESPATRSASTRLYQSHCVLYVCSRLLDLDFSQRSLLSEELKAG